MRAGTLRPFDETEELLPVDPITPAQHPSITELEPHRPTALAEVIALRECYPALNAQRNFIELQRELATTEDRIAAARRFYNTRVAELNRAIEAFPSAIVAGRHRFVRAELFES